MLSSEGGRAFLYSVIRTRDYWEEKKKSWKKKKKKKNFMVMLSF